MGKQEKSKDTDSFDNWLIWLKRAAYLGITVFLSVLISYFVNFAQWPWHLSPLPEDWSAFGSVLAGASAFLAAVGTVGVMLLSIKQFKLQQVLIEEQTERQNAFEARQQQKWDKENEMLNFQKYRMHRDAFSEELSRFERKYNIYEVYDKTSLYKECFPNNNFESTSYEVHCSGNDYIDELNLLFSRIESIDKSNPAYIWNLHNMVERLLEKARMRATYPAENGYVFFDDSSYAVNIRRLDFTTQLLSEFMYILTSFTGYKKTSSEIKISLTQVNPEALFEQYACTSSNYIEFKVDGERRSFPILILRTLRDIKLAHIGTQTQMSFLWDLNDLIEKIYDIHTTKDIIETQKLIDGFAIKHNSQLRKYDAKLDIGFVYKQSFKGR